MSSTAHATAPPVAGRSPATATMVLVLSLVVFGAIFMLLIVAAPLALCTHALPQIDWVATRWWRAMFAALTVPTAHGLILALIARVLLTPGGYSVLGFATASRLVNIMVLNALLWVMIKIPRWAWSTISHSAGAGGRPSLIGRVVRAVIAYKTVGLIGGAAGAAGWAEKATRGLPGPLRMFSGAAGQRGANPGIPRMATPGTAGTAHAGAATRLAALARARGRARPRRASGVGAVFFLAPGPAEPTRYRSTRTIPQPGGDPGSGVRPVSFVEPVVAQPEAADRKRRYGGVPTVVPVFQAPTPSAASGPVTGAGTPTGTRRGRHLPAAPSAVGAPLWSHPTAPAPRQARTGGAASPVGSARVVFVDPTTSGRAAVGVRGYSSTAAPVVFSSPSRDTSTQYRPEQLRNPRFPQPPGPTPPRPTTRVGLPRHRPADPKPATGGSGSSRKIGE